MSESFIHLRLHSIYSLLEGAMQLKALPKICADHQMPALALNIPTYLTLYGYGYRNVYELGESVSEKDPRIKFAGTKLLFDPKH